MTNGTTNSAAPRWPGWLAAGLLAAVVWAVFWRAQFGALLRWDDDNNIVANEHLRALSAENLRWMFTDLQRNLRYSPLAWLGWAVNGAWFGMSARSLHVGNLVFHSLNTVLVFWLSQRLLRLARGPQGEERSEWVGTAAAFLGALWWGIHPLRTEAVAWATARTYGQAVFFLLLATLAYLEAVTSVSSPARRRWLYWASVAAFTVSLLTYPVGLGFAAVPLAIECWLRTTGAAAFDGPRPNGLRGAGWRTTPFVVAAAGMVLISVWARMHASAYWTPSPSLAQFGLLARAMQASYVWVYYLWKPWWPFNLSPVYTTLVEFRAGGAAFVGSLIAVLAITGLVAWRRRQWPGSAALWFCHLALLVPVLGLTDHPHFPNDRYGYFASIPASVAVAALVLKLWRGQLWRPVVVAGSLFVAVCCAMLSVAQVRIWQDSVTLFRYMLAELGENPYRFDTLRRLGEALAVEGNFAEAKVCALESLRINPASFRAHDLLGQILEAEGQPAAAIAHYEQVVQFLPESAAAQFRLGRSLLVTGRTSEAVLALERSVRLEARDPDARYHLGVALGRTGQAKAARSQLEAALQLRPDFPAARAEWERLP